MLQRAPGDYALSEGEQKTRRYHTPSKGGRRQLETKTRVQALQKARAITHLRKVSIKRGKITHLRKVGEGSWKRKRGYRRYRRPRAITHLRKVSIKRGKITHLRKVGEGSWKPSEGGRRQLETETRAQALQRTPGDCPPSEGEQKTRRNHTPSEGGTRGKDRNQGNGKEE